MEITLSHYMVLSALLFCIGLFGALARRNAVGILMAIEIMLNAVNLAFIAMSRYVGEDGHATGQVFAIFIITVAAAEAAVALALAVSVYRLRGSIDVDRLDSLKW